MQKKSQHFHFLNPRKVFSALILGNWENPPLPSDIKPPLWKVNDQYIHSTARVFAIINLSINVFIYCVFNKKFKTTFCYLFWKCLAQNKNVPSGTINSNSKDGLSSKRTNMMHIITWPSYSQFNPVWIFPPFLNEEIRQ